jgi:hypothetical protein
MSNAQISRKLIINSPQEFYKIIKENNLTKQNIIPFLDRVDLFLNGCPCEAELHWEQTLQEYRKLSQIDLSHVKESIGCTSLEFYLEGNKLFDR